MPSKQTCIRLTTQSTSVKTVVYLRKQSHYRLSLRFCTKAYFSSPLKARFVSWSSPAVPELWVESQTRVEKGRKMGRTEAIQIGVVYKLYFERCHCLSVSVYSVVTWEKSRWLQGRKEGGKEGATHRAPHHLGWPKSPNNVSSTFFNTFHMLRKAL